MNAAGGFASVILVLLDKLVTFAVLMGVDCET